jgi:electron transport complex protein RnfC
MGIFEKIFRHHPPWGVHPDDHKLPAANAPLRSLPLPALLYVPMQQHVGSPARPVVLVGQHVLKGQLIAEAQGNVSAPVHAPTSGRISAIGEVTAPHPSGLAQLAITIAADGADTPGANACRWTTPSRSRPRRSPGERRRPASSASAAQPFRRQ